MFTKDKQLVGDDSIGVQAGRDAVVFVNQGLSIANVHELFQMLFRENFPRLRDEAEEAARANVESFISKFEKRLTDRFAQIDLNLLVEPDVQASLNDAIQASAKKGNKLNIDILSELIVARLQVDSSEFSALVAEEAIRVMPKLTREQLAFLGLSVGMNIHPASLATITDLENWGKRLLQIVKHGFDLGNEEKLYLLSLGVAVRHVFAYEGKWATLTTNYPFLAGIGNTEQIVRDAAPSFSSILDQYKNISTLELTAIGKLLGAFVVASCVDDTDPLTIFRFVAST